MTVLDERGEPVVVEYVGPGRYLASGWWGGVGAGCTCAGCRLSAGAVAKNEGPRR